MVNIVLDIKRIVLLKKGGLISLLLCLVSINLRLIFGYLLINKAMKCIL